MAWNSDERVRELSEYAERHGFEQAMLIGVNRTDGTIVAITYGRDKALCSSAKKLGDKAYDAVFEAIAVE